MPHLISNFFRHVFSEGMEEPIVGVTKHGFSLADVTIMEGQSIIFIWQDQTDAADVVQVCME